MPIANSPSWNTCIRSVAHLDMDGDILIKKILVMCDEMCKVGRNYFLYESERTNAPLNAPIVFSFVESSNRFGLIAAAAAAMSKLE